MRRPGTTNLQHTAKADPMVNHQQEDWVEETPESEMPPNEWASLHEEWSDIDRQFQELLSTAVEERESETRS
jgi:hypothetical protein